MQLTTASSATIAQLNADERAARSERRGWMFTTEASDLSPGVLDPVYSVSLASMKTEVVDVNATRKNVRVEIPSDIVTAEIDRIARDYSRRARVPGFRPGKTPPRVIKQRFKDQILHDVAHDLIPRAVDDALRENGFEAVDTPDVRDVNVAEGQPLTFTASFDTLPPFDPGDLSTIAFTRASSAINDEAVNVSMQRLRERAARFEPVEGRGVDHGDSAVVDLERRDEK